MKENNSRVLPLDVIDFIVKSYAIQPNGLKFGYANFSQNNLTDGEKEAYAHYFPDKKLLVLDREKAPEEFGLLVDLVLHEIQHYNQHVKWDTDEKYRLSIAKQLKLPKNLNTNHLKFINVVEYVSKAFSWEQNPLEIDAESFAEKNLPEAMKKIIDREKQSKAASKNSSSNLKQTQI